MLGDPETAEGAAELVRVLRSGGRLGVTAWPEDRDEPESDGKEAGELVESALGDAGLALEMPLKAAPAEAWLKDAANLRAVLEGAGLADVVFEERKYAQRLTASDYVGWRIWGGRGRYLRSVTRRPGMGSEALRSRRWSVASRTASGASRRHVWLSGPSPRRDRGCASRRRQAKMFVRWIARASL